MRRPFPKAVKVKAFERADGHCEKCTARLYVGKYHYDHDIPDALGGEPTLENCKVLCTSCHGAKTTRQDVPRNAKAKRQNNKHIGAKGRKGQPFPGGRNSLFKRKISGEVVRRDA